MQFNEAPESAVIREQSKRIFFFLKTHKGLNQIKKMAKIYLRRTVKEAVAEHWPRKFLALMVYFPLSLTDAFRISREYTFLERLTLIFEDTET